MANFINLEQAVKLTHAFQDSEIGKEQTYSGMVEKDILLEMLKQDNCEGIRIYNALNENGKITFVLVGYDKEDNDIIDGKIADEMNLCPPNCPKKKTPLINY